MGKEPTIEEMCVDYKNYRALEDEKIAKMSKEQRIEYMKQKHDNAINQAKADGMKVVSLAELLEGEDG